MEILFISIRIALSSVFAFAAYGKILDIPGTRSSVEKMGLDSRQAQAIAYLLPPLELLIAVGLLINQVYVVSAIAFAVLVLGFTLFLWNKFSKEDSSDCHCFGQISTEPVSAWTILRNVFLILAAVLLVLFSNPISAIDLFPGGVDTAQSIALFIVLHILFVVVHLIAENTRVKREVFEQLEKSESARNEDILPPNQTLPVGALIPTTVFGGVSRNSEGHFIVVFIGPECNPCRKLVPELLKTDENILFVAKGDKETSKSSFEDIPDRRIYFDETGSLSKDFRVSWTPTAIPVDSEYRIISKPAVGDTQIRGLVSMSTQEMRENSDFEWLGKPLPSFEAKKYGDEEFSETKLSGRSRLIVYWDQNCPFCVEIAKELDGLDNTAPLITLMTRGQSRPDSKKLLENLLVLPNDDFPKRIGMKGTPTGLLIDANGIVISEPAVGADQIRPLVGL